MSNLQIETSAARWKCSPRTIRRWIAVGINPDDIFQVVTYICGSKSATDRQLDAAERELAVIKATLPTPTLEPFLEGFLEGLKK
jgi:hypothetical protein